ncbi:MAG: hypothetical protein JXR22_12610, partial [Prolixibacteraceae bacterium]|nr:hypothetical protein [Prolixibacteraceae bacterium]
MKQILLICCLALAGSVFSQSIDHPQQGFSTVSNLKVTAIELTDSNTVLSFIYKGQPGTWILIPGGSCIQPVGTEQKYFATRTEGIPFGKEYWLDQSGSVEYSLFFPAIDPETERIDFREDNDGGSW